MATQSKQRRQPEVRAGRPDLTVVGIGASAGGLTALKELFSLVPARTGLAWVVVVHLSPEHDSHLAELLQRHSLLPVLQVTETVELAPDTIYVIPPNANLNAIDTHLRLSKLEAVPGTRATVDHFFRTLSVTHDGHAIGVILSGTGSDGSLGISEIKAKNGLTVVQDPEEAEYDGMPRSAIRTGVVDLVLPLREIPAAVLRYAQTEPRVTVPADGEELPADGHRQLQKIFSILHSHTGRDFSRYKRSTMLRRIVRRMQLRQVEELDRYLELLGAEPDEVRTLADDLLITVTAFFRDAPVFDAIAKDVLPRLFDGKGPGDRIRVWSVGCATGEEAYSLGMLMLEEAGRREAPPQIQIFASDLHERSLQKAREGLYPGDITVDVGPERLGRFFQQIDAGYRIRREVRELVVFSPHNLLGDPPFSRVDIVTCRNVLIYLQSDAQQQAMEIFHYALNPDGVLVLGSSERASEALFRVDDKEHGVFGRRNVLGPGPRLSVFPVTRARTPDGQPVRRSSDSLSYGDLHQRIVERYAPPSVLLNPEDRIVHISEHAGRYLIHPGGETTTSALKLIRPELQIELQTALHHVRQRGEPIQTRAAEVDLEGSARGVVLDVRPSLDHDEAGFVLVLFNEIPQTAPAPLTPAEVDERSPTSASAARIRELGAELEQARERLQEVIRTYDENRGDMNAANEELQSANEELRSTMEELETSKEELQSMNEELQTVNQENRHKVEELAQLSSDLQNLLTATDIATLFLDRSLRIMRFTRSAEKLFSVRLVDQGRPISELNHQLDYDALVEDAVAVLQHLVPIEREIQDEQKKRWYLARVLPYRSVEDRIEGVVLTFVDITSQKEAEEEIQRAMTFSESIVETLYEPLLVLHPDLTVKAVNRAFYDHFQARPEETVGRLIYDLGNGQWNIPELRTLLEEILPENHALSDYEVRHNFEEIGERVMLLDAQRLDSVDLILLAIRDITERAKVEEVVRQARAEAEEASRVKSQFLSTMSHELRTPLGAVLGFADLMETEVVGPLNDTQKEHLGRIKKSAWHLVRIIDEILDFSRAEAGKEAASVEQADLAEVTREVVAMLKGSAEESGHVLKLRGTDAFVRAKTDARKVTQILINLVGNALKYSEAGPIEIELVPDTEWAEIRVKDHGPGIPPDRYEDIFAAFVQIDGSSTRTHGGTGLGLTIARRYARLLGGELTVQSELGTGSTFTLRIPRHWSSVVN